MSASVRVHYVCFTGAQNYRFQVLITNQEGDHPARLEQLHRSRAAVEDSIRSAKTFGLRNLPFRGFAHRAAWLELVLLGCDLLAFTKNLLLEGELAAREPKRLRYRLLHVAGRIVTHARQATLRPARAWPWAEAPEQAFGRLFALPAADPGGRTAPKKNGREEVGVSLPSCASGADSVTRSLPDGTFSIPRMRCPAAGKTRNRLIPSVRIGRRGLDERSRQAERWDAAPMKRDLLDRPSHIRSPASADLLAL